jgi:hypothetical protein
VLVSAVPFVGAFRPPKENSEWLFEDDALSMGTSADSRLEAIDRFAGLRFSLFTDSKPSATNVCESRVEASSDCFRA